MKKLPFIGGFFIFTIYLLFVGYFLHLYDLKYAYKSCNDKKLKLPADAINGQKGNGYGYSREKCQKRQKK